MAYEKQTFVDREKDASGNVLVEGTKLKAEHLNHIEEGIAAVEKKVDEIVGLPEVTESDDGKLLQVVDGAWSTVTITDGNEVAY